MSVAKKQTEFTLEEAREAALSDLAFVITFAKNLGTVTELSAPAAWVAVLESLRNKVRIAVGPSLPESEIRTVFDFGQMLITSIPSIASQLCAFWSLHEAIAARLQGPEAERGYQPERRIAELSRRIDDSDRFGLVVVREAQKSSGVLALGAILMVHVARVDTIEYALVKQLREAVRRFKLEEEFDPAAICSVEERCLCRGRARRSGEPMSERSETRLPTLSSASKSARATGRLSSRTMIAAISSIGSSPARK